MISSDNLFDMVHTEAHEPSDEEVSEYIPAHPAIPDGVASIIDQFCDTVLLALPGDQVSAKVGMVRDWLAKCPVATNKATCPKCGDEADAKSYDYDFAVCHNCDHYRFPIKILIISPPLEPKETP